MSEQAMRITVPRPPQPYYPPGQCGAPVDRDTPNVRCNTKPARPYPCGWRCDDHAPGRQTSPIEAKEAA